MTDVVDAAEQEYLGRTPVGDAVQTFFYSFDNIAVYAPVYNFRARISSCHSQPWVRLFPRNTMDVESTPRASNSDAR